MSSEQNTLGDAERWLMPFIKLRRQNRHLIASYKSSIQQPPEELQTRERARKQGTDRDVAEADDHSALATTYEGKQNHMTDLICIPSHTVPTIEFLLAPPLLITNGYTQHEFPQRNAFPPLKKKCQAQLGLAEYAKA